VATAWSHQRGERHFLNRQIWTSRDELRLAIITWIERTYHRRRRQGGRGKLTPIELEAVIGYDRPTEAA
jgi:transposase InsO family protein